MEIGMLKKKTAMIQEQHDFSTLSKILCKWEIRDSRDCKLKCVK